MGVMMQSCCLSVMRTVKQPNLVHGCICFARHRLMSSRGQSKREKKHHVTVDIEEFMFSGHIQNIDWSIWVFFFFSFQLSIIIHLPDKKGNDIITQGSTVRMAQWPVWDSLGLAMLHFCIDFAHVFLYIANLCNFWNVRIRKSSKNVYEFIAVM